MSVSFIQPAYLWLLLLLLPLTALGLLSPRRIARMRLWSSLVLRAIMFVALVMVLAGAAWARATDQLTTIFVLDSSDSISAPARAKAEAFVQTALKQMPPGDRAAIIVFGKEPLVERAPSEDRRLVRLTVAPPGTYTDIERAIQLAMTMMPAETNKRIVLLSEGGENRGSAMTAALLARAAQIPIETVSLQGPPPDGDTVLESVEAPATVRAGEDVRLTLHVQAPRATTGRLRVWRDRTPIIDQATALQAGLNRPAVIVPAPPPGFHTWEAHVDAAGDTVGANNVAFGFSNVVGPPTIAIVEGAPGRGDNLRAALEAGGMHVTTMAPAAVPASLAALQRYDALALVDVSYNSLAPATARLLPAYVRDLGHGLLMVGGADSFGAGGYLNTPVETAMPVTMQTRGVKIRPDVALVLVIDHSGSMAGDKLDLAREGAVEAFGALDDADQIGVIQFDTTAEWAVPLQKRPTDDSFISAIQGIGVGGGTDLRPGLVAAADALEKAQARVKHIVLLTDGQAGLNYDDVVTQLKNRGITLTAVGVGADYDPHLKDITPITGGRFYAASAPADIPKLFFDETLRISRRGIVEHDFTPTRSFPAVAIRDINIVPALHGYNAVTAKSTAQVALLSDESDPILAQWQYGLGLSAAWTSDLRGQWAREWVSSDTFGRFANQLVGSLLPTATPAGWEAGAHVEGNSLAIALQALGSDNLPLTGLHPTGRFIGADGQIIAAPLVEIAPGSYRAAIGLPDAGVYQVQVAATGPNGQPVGLATTGAVVPPSAEYLQRDGNSGLLQQLARVTGGHTDPAATAVWTAPAGITRRTVPLTWPLVWLALLVWPLDIALRRLLVTQGSFTTRRDPSLRAVIDVQRARALLQAGRRSDHDRRTAQPPQPVAPRAGGSPQAPAAPRFDWRSTRRSHVERPDDRDQ